MSDYIEREAAIDACFNGWNNNAHDCAENIRAIPAIDVRPVVRGRWESVDDVLWLCSKCHYAHSRSNYCPNCGADMRESEGE